MVYANHAELHYPTVDELNHDNNSLKTHLLILRCMNTSDLAFHYMLYDARTVLGMLHQAESHYEFCRTDPTITIQSMLTTLEQLEYLQLCKVLREYCELHLDEVEMEQLD